MRKKRILVLMHKDLVPPKDISLTKNDRIETEYPWITEWDVINNLKSLGHEVKELGVYDDLGPIRTNCYEFKPHVVFNLLEEFDGNVLMDQNVVSFLELLKIPYTGVNPRGLILGRDKALAKKVLSYHRIKTPKFWVFNKKKKITIPKNISFPLIVKCKTEEASLGISKNSIVKDREKLIERIQFIHNKFDDHALVEEFIEGREVYVGLLGNNRLKSFPIWEVCFEKSEEPEKEFYTRAAKWNPDYRKRKGITSKRADLPEIVEKEILKICKKVYKVLEMDGYARIDLRLDSDLRPYVLEVNPNPNICMDDEFALSAKFQGKKYTELLEDIIKLGLNR